MDERERSIRILPTETYFAMVRRMLSESGSAYVRITGMSMWPLLHHLRDGVVIEPLHLPDSAGIEPQEHTDISFSDDSERKARDFYHNSSSKAEGTPIYKQIHPGDIVLFDRQNGRYALHRVIRTKRTGFSMAGDNQWHIEANLPYEQIVGVVTCIERNGHRLSSKNLLIKAYSYIVVLFTYPRIFIYKGVRRLIRFLK